MTTDHFRRLRSFLFPGGENESQLQFSNEFRVNLRSVQRMSSGRQPVPDGLAAEVAEAARRKMKDILAATDVCN